MSDVVEFGPDPDDETIRDCVSTIRDGDKVRPLEGASKTLLHAIVRYANGLPAAPGGEEAWQRVQVACEGEPTPDADGFPAERHFGAMVSALTYASEFLLAASLPDPVERLGAIIGVALVTSPGGFETDADTKERMNVIAEVVYALAFHPEKMDAMLEELRRAKEETGEAETQT